jgi:sugar-phosphatase
VIDCPVDVSNVEPVSYGTGRRLRTTSNPWQQYRAVLFDCDGVLVDTRQSCRDAWASWAHRVGMSTGSIDALQGRPVREVMEGLVPAERLDQEILWFEELEVASSKSVVALPGAAKVLAGLPRDTWAIVTSASSTVANARLVAAGLPVPDVLITADDIQWGKPEPDCYRLAATRLGVNCTDCAAVEDSEVGARAAHRAGAAVVGVGPSISKSCVDIGPVADLSHLQMVSPQQTAYGATPRLQLAVLPHRSING